MIFIVCSSPFILLGYFPMKKVFMVLVTITNNMSIMMKSLHIEEAGSSKNACDQYCKHKEKYPQRKFKYGGG